MFAAFKGRLENNSLFQKIRSGVCCSHPARQEGRYGQSSPDAARDAMDADVRNDEAHRRGRRNRVVPIPRRWNQVLRDERKATVANKPGTPRRSRISRNTIARGMPVVLAEPVLLACAKCTVLCTQGPRVRPASGVPRALCLSRVSDDARLGRNRVAGMWRLVSVIASAAKQSTYPLAALWIASSLRSSQ